MEESKLSKYLTEAKEPDLTDDEIKSIGKMLGSLGGKLYRRSPHTCMVEKEIGNTIYRVEIEKDIQDGYVEWITNIERSTSRKFKDGDKSNQAWEIGNTILNSLGSR